MTAVEFLKNTGRQILSSNYYGRLLPGDGLMIVDKDKVIIAANRTARHLFKVQGLSNLVGRRTNSLQINWPLVGMVLKTGVAEGKEIDMQGLLLAMRVILLRTGLIQRPLLLFYRIYRAEKERYRAAYQICSYSGNTSSR